MIRAYKQSDKQQLIDIFRKNTPEFFAEEELSEFNDYLQKFPETYKVVLFSNEVVGGFGSEYRESDNSGRINWIFLHPDFKGKELGAEAVNFCFSEFSGNNKIETLIIRTSQHAWKFFSKFGYRLEEIKKDYWAKEIDLYLMKMSASDLKAIQTWGSAAKQYKEKFSKSNLYKESYDYFLNLIPQNGALLEVACGPGTITQYLTEKRSDLKIEATDYSREMIQLAKETITGPEFFLMDCRNIAQLGKKYHAIVCGFVLPYLTVTETEKFINDSSGILADKGIFYLSFIEGSPERSAIQKSSDGKYQLFVNYYTKQMVSELLINNGFAIENVFQPTWSNGTSKDIHTIIIAVK